MSKLRKRARERDEPRYTIPQRSLADPVHEVIDAGFLSLPLGLQQAIERTCQEGKEDDRG